HLLGELGHRVDGGHQPAALAELGYLRHYMRAVRVSLVAELAMFEPALGRPFTADDVEEGTWINQLRGRKVSAVDYVYSRDALIAYSRRLIGWWHDGHDLLLTPTVAVPPPPVGHLIEGDERTLVERLVPITAFTPQFNVSGQPAISLPLGTSTDGLPLGVQLVAAPGREDLLLQVAAQLEQAAPWHDRRPAIWAGAARPST
ncbi:MAG: amidase family protein, partial [Actinomycetota bacterium]